MQGEGLETIGGRAQNTRGEGGETGSGATHS